MGLEVEAGDLGAVCRPVSAVARSLSPSMSRLGIQREAPGATDTQNPDLLGRNAYRATAM
jgi:hypothetical protein